MREFRSLFWVPNFRTKVRQKSWAELGDISRHFARYFVWTKSDIFSNYRCLNDNSRNLASQDKKFRLTTEVR